jgi:hypothetical protein
MIMLKMNDIFNIDELVENILSFVPRAMIGSCLFVNKRFNKLIKVDDDYENVARNGDLFSLNKIVCSYDAVINIAKKYENIAMMEWIIKNKRTMLLYDWQYANFVGFIGDIDLLNGYKMYLFLNGVIDKLFVNMVNTLKILDDDYDDLDDILENDMCFKLLKKYETQLSMLNIDYLVEIAFRIHNNAFTRKLISSFKLPITHVDNEIIYGKCSRNDTKYVKSYIDKYSNSWSLYQITKMYDGLIEGGHYDIFIEMTKKVNYKCISYSIINKIIMDNNYKFFTYFVDNNLEIYDKDGHRYTYDDIEHNEVEMFFLIQLSIHYKRVKMLLFLLNNITFTTNHYKRCMELVDKLKFDDVKNIIIQHKELFKDDYII